MLYLMYIRITYFSLPLDLAPGSSSFSLFALDEPLALAPTELLVLVTRKHRKSIPVERRVSANVFFTPSKWSFNASSPGRRTYACEILLYTSDKVFAARRRDESIEGLVHELDFECRL